MAEETGVNQEKDTGNKEDDKPTNYDMVASVPNPESQHKERCNCDGWIVVRSQKRPGMFYDFHVPTGQSRWREEVVKKAEPNQAAIKSPQEVPFCGFEPTEPADNPPANHHDTPSTVPKIYNKQIINNQFPFGNASYTQCNNNTAWTATPPMIYSWSVPPPVLINSTVTPFNQPQTSFGPVSNLPTHDRIPFNPTVPNLNQVQTGFAPLPVQNMPFNTPAFNQAQTIVGPLPNLPTQNTLAQAQTGFAVPFNTPPPPINQPQTVVGPLPNLPTENISVPLNTPRQASMNQTQTIVGPSLPEQNQTQTGYKPVANLPIKNTSIPLNNRFQVLKQFNCNSPANLVKSRLGLKRIGNFPPRNQQNYIRRNSNNPNDLRSLLSGRNRQDLKEEILECPVPQQTKEDIPSIDEDEINPDDMDNWLEDHTDDEGKKLTIDMECIWKLADSTASRESWYIVPTAIVLLNNVRFFTSLVNTDERARLLAPLSVIRALRSATFSGNARAADCAKRAMVLVRRSSKHPDTPKNQPNITTCLELIDQNKLVVLLFDERDKEQREIINDIPKFTVNELKQYLSQNTEANAIDAIQKIENITIVVPIKGDETQSTPRDIILSQRIELSQVPHKVDDTRCILRDIPLSPRIEPNPVPNEEVDTQGIPRDNTILDPIIQKPYEAGHNTTERLTNTSVIQRENKTDLSTNSEKRTVNASVQTDFQIILAPAKKCSEEGSERSETKMDLGETCNKVIDTKIAPRKIRLKRQNQSLNVNDSQEIRSFKWRKRKNTSTPNSTASLLDSHISYSSPSTSTCDYLHLVTQHGVTARSPQLGFSETGVSVQQNDNAVEVELSDVDAGAGVQHDVNAIEPAFSDDGVDVKTVDESFTSGVISNSIDSDFLFRKQQPSPNELKDLPHDAISHKEIEYGITSEFMKEHLSSNCDEWVSRFSQIMEEVLTQVLHMEPPYVDNCLPPPWNVQEATACIKRKLKSNAIIVKAADKLEECLYKICDDRGNIRTDIRPEDFMKMYGCGVNLVNAFQVVLQHEDLQIASDYLSQLLSDIREPNLDLSTEFETYCDDDAGSPNISESIITNMSTTDAVGSNTAPAVNESPRHEEKRVSCNNSPARYSLRSSQRSNRAHDKQKEDNMTEVVSDAKNDAGYSLFSSLGLRKINVTPDTCIVKTIINVPQDQTPQDSSTILAALVSDNIEKENKDAKVTEPRIIRNFNVCPEIENKLKDINSVSTEIGYALPEEYVSEDYGMAEDTDFTKDETFEYEPEGKCNVLKLSVYVATYAMKRCIMVSRKFCEETHNALKGIDNWDAHYKADVLEKTTKVSILLKNVCDRLKRILNRDPSATKDKFRILTKELGTPGVDMSDTELTEYRAKIQKYLNDVNFLQTFVTLLDTAVKKK